MHIKRLVACAAVTWLCAPGSFAASAGPTDETQAQSPTSGHEVASEQLDTVTVSGSRIHFKPEDSTSATKFPLKLIETPQAVTVLPEELLRVTGVQSLGDAGDLAPGVQDGDRDISTFSDFVSRGFRVNFFQGYKINGLSIVNEGFQLDPYMVDRVEFVRGPSSIIYGQSDYGLTVNSILKQPRARRTLAAQLQFDEFGTANGGVDLVGAMTADERLLGRLVVSYVDTKSFQDFAFRKQISVAPSLTWQATENTSVDLQAYHADTKLRDAFGFPLATDAAGNFVMLDVPKDGFWSAAYKRTDGTSTYGELRLTHRFANDLTFKVSLADMVLDRTWDDPYLDSADTSGATTIYDYREDRRVDVKTVDATLYGNFDAFEHSHTFMLNVQSRNIHDKRHWGGFTGAFDDVEFNVLHPDPRSVPKPDIPLIYLDPKAHDIDSAVSGMLLLRPLDRLSVMLGGRLNRLSRKVRRVEDGVQTLDVDFVTKKFSSRFALTYELLPTQVFGYVSYSEGVLFQNEQNVDGSVLGPELGKQYEVGLKADLLKGRLGGALALFKLDRGNVAAPDPANPLFYRGIGGQVHKGAELELLGQPVEGVNVLASYAYTKVKITESADPAEIGRPRANTPRNLAKVFVTWEPARTMRKLSIGGGIFYRDAVEVDNVGSFQLPSYTRIDLTVGYQFTDQLKVALIGQNVTDEDILVSFADSPYYGLTFKDARRVMLQANWQM